LLLIAALIASCAPSTELVPVVDLVQALPGAEFFSERRLVDFGTSAGGSHLVRGWSWREKSRDGTTFVWSSGKESVLEFFVAEPRDLDVRVRCLAYPFAAGASQAVTVKVGGTTVGAFQLPGQWSEETFQVPGGVIEAGVNEMTFEYARITGPGESRGGERPLAVAFDWVQFNGLQNGADGPAAVDPAEPELLTVSSGSRIDYFFEAPPGAVLSIEGLEFRGGKGELSIDVQGVGVDEEVIARIARDIGSKQWPLDAGAPDSEALDSEARVFRLRLGVMGDGGAADDLRAAVVRPRILAPQTAVEPSSIGKAVGGKASPAESHQGEGAREQEAGPENIERPNVILYVVDTLRADHLGPYGYSNPITPELDAFASQGVTFEAAVAQAPWTLPAMASVFTGLSPKTHATNTKQSRLPQDVTTLTDLFLSAGYSTGAVVANGFVSEAFGFSRGFDMFELFPDLGTRVEELQDAALDWLDASRGEQPLFLFVHAIDPHDSYDPPDGYRPEGIAESEAEPIGSRAAMKVLKKSGEEPARELLADLLSLYDGEIAYTDWAFGRFLDDLRQRELLDTSVVVFMSDHGEEFFDHGDWLHGHSLHAELTSVPLIMRFPGGLHAGERVALPVQQIDLMPTLAEYLGLQAPPGIEGRSLLGHLEEGAAVRPPESIFSYLDNRLVSVVRGDLKLIVRRVGGKLRRRALYDRSDDPLEMRNLGGERPIVAGFLSSLIAEELQRQGQAVTGSRAVIDKEMKRHLEALGYLN
jgi:arylsulfatase A-like enzyme